jgi:L-fuconolactonase
MMDSVGIDAAVTVTPKLYGYDNSYSLHAAALYPDRIGVVGRVDPLVESPETLVDTWSTNPAFLAFRLMLMSADDAACLGSAVPLLRAAENYSVPMCIYPPFDLHRVETIAQTFGSLQIVIDHLGFAPSPPVDGWSKSSQLMELVALARNQNVTVKLSAAPLLSKVGFPFEDLWPAIDAVLTAFGVDRVMWGSDYTQGMHRLTYSEGLHYLLDSPELTSDEKDRILSKTARRVFKWDPPGRHKAAH